MNSRARFRLNAKRRIPVPAHSLSCDERGKPPVSRSRSTEARGAEGGNGTKVLPSTHPPPPVISPHPLSTSSPTCVDTPHPTPTHRKKKRKKKQPWGLPPAVHQGELSETASPRDSTDKTPNTSTFCLSYVGFFFSFSFFFCFVFFQRLSLNGIMRKF